MRIHFIYLGDKIALKGLPGQPIGAIILLSGTSLILSSAEKRGRLVTSWLLCIKTGVYRAEMRPVES